MTHPVTPAQLAAAVLADPEALWLVAEALPNVRLARWVREETWDGQHRHRVPALALVSPTRRRLAWAVGKRCWWDGGRHTDTGVSLQPSRWEGRSCYEPVVDMGEAKDLITALFVAAGWLIADCG